MKILKRTLTNIRRSGWRNYLLISMMTATYTVLGLLLLVLYTTQNLVGYFIQKPEVVGFLKVDATEDQVLTLKRDLENRSYIASIKYVSREEAMKSFIEENKDNKELIEDISANIFPAHLNIKANDLNSVEKILVDLKSSNLIEDVIASEDILATLKKIILGIQIVGFSLLGVFIVSTILVIFLTIGISVYSYKNEMIVMKLIGATNWYVRSPFIFQSIIYTVLAVLISSSILVPLVYVYYDEAIRQVLGNIGTFGVSITALLIGIGITFLFGLVFSVTTTYFATRRYIQV